MDLTDNEAAEAFLALTRTLREVGLDWVVTQVEEKLALGKLQAKRLRAFETTEIPEDLWEFNEPGAGRQSKRVSAVFTVAEQYSPQERLVVLLEAVVLSVATLNEVAVATFDHLKPLGVNEQLGFAPEADVSEPYALHASAIRDRMQATVTLLALIAELRGGDPRAGQAQSSV